MAIAWGDESVRKTNMPEPMYLMGACICDIEEQLVRSQLELIKPRNASKLHWRDMRPAVRNKAIDAIDQLKLRHVIVAAVPLDDWSTSELARRKCLETLLPLLEQEYQIDRFVLEQRDKAQNAKDIRFVDAMRSRKFIQSIRVDLLPGASDARLWLPDQLLGAYGDAQSGEGHYDAFLTTVRVISISEADRSDNGVILSGKPTPLGKWK